VKGHGRLMAAQRLGMETVPVDWQDYSTDEEEKADRIADNKISELAEDNMEALLSEMQEINLAGADLELLGMGEEELDGLLSQIGGGEGPPPEAEPQIDMAEELREKWGVETGQLWQLGDHRILCGDSTKVEDVARVLAGDKPFLMVTDPPYGVEYDATWRKAAMPDTNPGKAGGMHGKVFNDDRADWREVWQLFPGDVAYVWHAGNKAHIVAESLISCGIEIVAQIIWAKTNHVIGRGNYHPKHEPCWYAVKKGGARNFTEDRTQNTLWEIASNKENETRHSTQKPVECMARPIRNHDSEFVYEPFSGSGTTIIACEQLGRKCRAIEISPGYVAVAIQRWVDATGGAAKLIG
jgi:DNA modification methylase